MAAETAILGLERQSLGCRGFLCGIRRGISVSGSGSGRLRSRVVSIEPLFLASLVSSCSAMIDSGRIYNTSQGGAIACSHKTSAASNSRVKNFAVISKFSLGKRSASRDFCPSVSATAGPGQTFPSQNGGGEKALPAKPDPSVEPNEVVLAQLKALRERDLATVYEFASPANKAHTGPLPRFTQMLEGRAYSLMIGHMDARVLSSMTISPNRFQQRIVITGANGKNATFSWALSKQEEGAYEGCWMTDTVRRDD